jgi:hypothetical protein
MHADPSKSTSARSRSLAVALLLLCSLLPGLHPGADLAVASATCALAPPEDGDYCDEDLCGPCGEGEGDCDPGECQAGLECVSEGSVDHCRPLAGGPSNLQVNLGGVWIGVCCDGDTPRISGGDCQWTEDGRRLTDEAEERTLDCPEGGPTSCDCSNGSGEKLHGYDGGNLDESIDLPLGGPIYSGGDKETCVVVDEDGELRTERIDEGCPDFRLR